MTALALPPVASPPPRTSRLRRRQGRGASVVRLLSRVLTVVAVVAVVGLLPWLSGRDPALTVLRGRSADQEATPEALAAVREQLGLADGPLALLGRWASDVLRGDFGTSWVSGAQVLPGALSALGVSVTLMAFSFVVVLAVAALLVAPSLLGVLRGSPRRTSGAVAAALTALPEFLLATALLVVVSVWLGLLPPYGWDGPSSAVLPALAMGLPAGGLVGRLIADAVATSGAETWVSTWTAAGAPRAALTRGLLLRAVPPVLPQIGLVAVGLVGGAVAVERVFAIPGLGRTTLGAAQTQDLPVLQAGMLLLIALGALLGVATDVTRRAVLGRAARAGGLVIPSSGHVVRRRDRLVPLTALLLLAVLVLGGLAGDPYAADRGRLAGPSGDLLLGADASGRDLLARLGQGAATTIATALAVCLAAYAVGLLAGLLPNATAGPVEVANAAPPVIAGLFVAAVVGPSSTGAAVAVLLVSWAPLASHTAALVAEAVAQPHVRVLPVLGVGRTRALLTHVLPMVAGPVLRNAFLRLPGVALALAGLGFLGLGPQPPTPDWGLVLAEGMPYVERAPWVVLAPALSLVALSVLAVSASALAPSVRRRPGRSARPATAQRAEPVG
ncbi:ABC transporter permease subunit [Motilibacter deserti]|uniref:ABC transporter permease subunit n=1 Tax=Motilibacter deserti TaxID=2714956 RepID=A0ABX0GVF8_9ACTN|nr:ABC transporter permease subunit [Motilibacter deserti]